MRCGRTWVVMAVAVLAAACSSGGREATVDPTTPASTTTVAASSTTAPTTSTTPPTIVAPTTTVPEPVAETDVGVLGAFVEEHSGLTFDDQPEVERGTITRQDMGFDPGFFVDERLWELFVPLGLVGPGDDRVAAGQARLDQVRGVCCPVRLFATDDHPLLESVVVVHELTHLIDEQRSLRRGTRSDEPLRFDSVVLEGNAQRVALRYRAELEAAGARPSRFALDWAEPRIPPAVLEVFELPYEEGAAFSAALFDRGGLHLVEESFRRPPISSEQVLDVDAYLDDERPVTVEPPSLPAGAEATATGTIGSFVLRLMAEQTLDVDAAHDLVTRWAGDHYALYERAGRSCLVATVVMDDPTAAAELVEAVRGAGVGATVDRAAPVELTVRRCARPPTRV